MPEMTFFNGLVTLDALGERAFWRMLLVVPVTLFAFYCLIPHRMNTKKARLSLLGAYCILWLNFMFSHLRIFPSPAAGMLGSVLQGAVEYIAYPVHISRYRDQRTLFLMFTIWIIGAQVDALANLFYQEWHPIFLHALLTCMFFLLLLGYFVIFQRSEIWASTESQPTGWVMLSALLGLICIALLLFRCYPDPLSRKVQNPFGVLLMSILLPAFYRVLFHTLAVQRNQARLKQDAALLQTQIHMVQEQERQMERHVREQAVARHDQRHFLQAVLAYLDAGDAEGARAEIRTQLKRGEKSIDRYCEDPVFNQLLAYYVQWAKTENIRFSIQAFMPEVGPGRRIGLMMALCNSLENAIHAAIQVPEPERQIRLILHHKGHQVYFEISNSYHGTLQLNPDTGLPSTDRPGHGLGLQSIASLSAQPPVCTAEDGIFTLRMLI